MKQLFSFFFVLIIFLKGDCQSSLLDSNWAHTNTDPKQVFKNLFLNTPSQLETVQLHPQAANFVQDYFLRHEKNLKNMKTWGRPYFDLMDEIFGQYSLPRELKYLAVIESYLKTYAVSWAGAVGPWQFMPATAKRMGLRVNNVIDERTDYFKSTHAAARYLNELFSIYNDWLLVIAAYNGGPGNVNTAIRRSNSKNFWELQNFLPAESRNHVKKFIATHYIMEGNGSITTQTNAEAKEFTNLNSIEKNITEEEFKNSKVQTINGKFLAVVISKYLAISPIEFNRYNPNFDKTISVDGFYELRLPVDKLELFNAKRSLILNESLHLLLNKFHQSMPEQSTKNKLE